MCHALLGKGDCCPCFDQNRYLASSSSGKAKTVLGSALLSFAPCDIKDPLALTESLVGCRVVMYAASASKQTSTAKAIDNYGA